MKEKVLITGGNGLVAQKLAKKLVINGFEVCFLSRSSKKSEYKTYNWDINKGYIDILAFENLSYVIHLAGAGVADKRWTDERKKEILDSRVNSTKILYKYINDNKVNLKAFVSASAVGYYGFGCKDEILTENSPNGSDFLANVCLKWENESLKFNNIGINTHILRTGIVLSSDGAALAKMAPIFKLGLGAAIGDGKQIMPWIHIDDLCDLFIWSIKNPTKIGIYNAVAENPVSNFEFSKILAQTLRKPFFLPNVPVFILKVALGELALMITTGMNVSCKKILDEGFKFQFSNLRDALKDLLK